MGIPMKSPGVRLDYFVRHMKEKEGTPKQHLPQFDLPFDIKEDQSTCKMLFYWVVSRAFSSLKGVGSEDEKGGGYTAVNLNDTNTEAVASHYHKSD